MSERSNRTSGAHSFPVFLAGVLAGGIVAPILLYASDAAMWLSSLNSPERATLLAGLGGASFGGVVAFTLSLLNSRESRLRDENQFRLRERALAQSALIKASMIHSDVSNILDAVNESISRARREEHDEAPLWLSVNVPLGSHQPIAIDASEIAVFMAAGRNDLFSGLVSASMQHAQICEGMNLYIKLRFEIRDMLTADSTVGRTTIIRMSPEDRIRLSPRTIELETLIIGIHNQLVEYEAAVGKIVDAIGPAMQKYFDDPTFPCLTLPNADTTAHSSQKT